VNAQAAIAEVNRPPVAKIFLTPREVCERYGNNLHERTLANWRSGGTGPEYTKVGGLIMYPISKLEEWEQRQTVQSTSQYRGSATKEHRK
jgi:hypothetical protein